MKMGERDYFISLLLGGTMTVAALVTAVPARANTTPVASFAPARETKTSEEGPRVRIRLPPAGDRRHRSVCRETRSAIITLLLRARRFNATLADGEGVPFATLAQRKG
jgi:hypothetical protein